MRPRLAASYETCRRLHRQHGRTYYLATRLLTADRRRHVHALYGFARFADDIVDVSTDALIAQRESALRAWQDQFEAGLSGVEVDDPVLPAVLDTIAKFQLDENDFSSFFRSMAMDLTVRDYRTYDDLLGYMEGSAAVIGTMTLPLLDPADLALAREPARQLGFAFQLTNFIRDIDQDLGLGRVYLPREDLEAFGVTRDALCAAADGGTVTPAIRALVAYEIGRARAHYAAAAQGVPMLGRTAQACVRTAFHLYAGILAEIERHDHDVFARRAVVPARRRLGVVARCLLTPMGQPVVPLGREVR